MAIAKTVYRFVVLFAIYGVYLIKKSAAVLMARVVRQLPAAVYGRMVNLEPDMPVSKNEMVKLLKATQYRSVTKMTRPGEFLPCRPIALR